MGKPTKQELMQALKEAAHMREQGEDPDFIAKSLLNLNYRMKYLEKVLFAAEVYLRGEGGHEHTELVQAIKTYHDVDAQTEKGHDKGFFI